MQKCAAHNRLELWVHLLDCKVDMPGEILDLHITNFNDNKVGSFLHLNSKTECVNSADFQCYMNCIICNIEISTYVK
jgi:hypothetical protein